MDRIAMQSNTLSNLT